MNSSNLIQLLTGVLGLIAAILSFFTSSDKRNTSNNSIINGDNNVVNQQRYVQTININVDRQTSVPNSSTSSSETVTFGICILLIFVGITATYKALLLDIFTFLLLASVCFSILMLFMRYKHRLYEISSASILNNLFIASPFFLLILSRVNFYLANDIHAETASGILSSVPSFIFFITNFVSIITLILSQISAVVRPYIKYRVLRAFIDNVLERWWISLILPIVSIIVLVLIPMR